MGRLFDSLLAWLMRPRVRVFRRWSFVITVPVALVVAHLYGVQQGALVIVLRAALAAAVASAAWRVGGERGDALRDLLMHPRARAFARAEFDIVTAFPRVLAARVTCRRQAGMGYHRGTFGLALALAFTPVVLSETVVFHLLLGGGIFSWIATAAHAYALLWLWAFCLGARLYPHRVGPRTAVLRNGPMYRVQIPLAEISRVTARTERVSVAGGVAEREDAVLLPARGRVDVWLELTEPVRVQRPLDEPLATRRIAVASDDPEALMSLLLTPPSTRAARRSEGRIALLGAVDLGDLTRDAVQPG